MRDSAPRVGRYRMCAGCAMAGAGHADYCTYAVHLPGDGPYTLCLRREERKPGESDEVSCIRCVAKRGAS